MTPALRRFTFTTHITSSVGWVGAVLAFLALAIIGLTSPDEHTARGAYLVMAPAAWFVLVPLAHASLLSGLALSVGTTWGLFRHYWVVLKLLITVFATAILLIYMRTFEQMAGIAADPVVDLGLVRNASPTLHAVLALILLVTATVLGVYKPFGMTPYGRRKYGQRRQAFPPITSAPRAQGREVVAARPPAWDVPVRHHCRRSSRAVCHPSPRRPRPGPPLIPQLIHRNFVAADARPMPNTAPRRDGA